MNTRPFKLVILGVLGSCTLAMGATYFWNGNGADADWDTCGNWRLVTPICYPSVTTSDAIVPDCAPVSCTKTIDLIDEEIEDMTLYGDVDFGSATGQGVLLEVESLSITGPAVVTTSSLATITAGTP